MALRRGSGVPDAAAAIYSAETCRTAQALILIWHELPALVGPRWPEVFPAFCSALSKVAAEPDPHERDWAVAELLQTLEPFRRALVRLAAVRKVLGQEPGTRGPGPIQPTPLPSWAEVGRGITHCLEPEPVQRYTDIAAPERLPRGKQGLIVVRVTAEPPAGSAAAEPLVIRLDRQLEVHLTLLSPDLVASGPRTEELVVPEQGNSKDVVFRVSSTILGPKELRLDFRQDGLAVGIVPLSIEIVEAAEDEAPASILPAPLELGGPAVPPPDLDLLITTREDRETGGTWFDFQLHSPNRSSVHHFDQTPSRLIPGSLAAFREELMKELEGISRGKEGTRYAQPITPEQAQRRLIALGERLFDDVLPPALQRDLSALDASAARTMQLTTDEPWIPWELLKPRQKRVAEESFLCDRFRLTRWLSGKLRQWGEVRVKRLACVEAGKAVAAHSLDGPPADRALLGRLARDGGLADASLADADLAAVEILLDDGAVELWHFAGHGSLHLDDAAPGSIHLLRRTVLKPAHLDRARQERIAAHHPLVFLNVCSAAQQGVALTGLGGWVDAWVEKARCSLFIAPLCTVDDGLAHLFAATFYTALSRGETVGEAVLQARRAVKAEAKGDPTWLAYSVYGHPNARVVLSGHAG